MTGKKFKKGPPTGTLATTCFEIVNPAKAKHIDLLS